MSADIIWILSDYIANRIPQKYYKGKKIITTIHHIVPWKVTEQQIKHFKFLDSISDYFTVIESRCKTELMKYVTKPIRIVPFWHNEKLWRQLDTDKYVLRMKYGIPSGLNDFIIGSFQRDTEGAGIPEGIYKPKFEKGPDLFVKAVVAYRRRLESNPDTANKKITVLLTGYRRQYIMRELKKNDIPYVYIQMCNITVMNELYNCLDLYIVSSRVEGGPRAINECSLTKTPLFSTDVGIAQLLCHPNSIIDMDNIDISIYSQWKVTNVEYNYSKAQKYTIENYMEKFNKLMFEEEELYEV